MSRSDDLSRGRRLDLRDLVLLAWALVFGFAYARMVLERKAPMLLRSWTSLADMLGLPR